jgi:hypothetical protein
MTQKEVQERFQFRQAVEEFATAAYSVSSDHSFALGYMQSFAVLMFQSMNDQQRAEFLADMQTAAATYKRLAAV